MAGGGVTAAGRGRRREVDDMKSAAKRLLTAERDAEGNAPYVVHVHASC